MREFIKILVVIFITISLLFGFTLPLNPPPGNWNQQFMPNLNGASITDITFTDTLNGFAVTSLRSGNDSAYILKTTNGGDNWNIKFIHNRAFVRVVFINANTGFTNAFTRIYKTTDAGETWNPINLPSIFGDDMFVLNQDTIWLAMSESLTGGVFRTTNGGVNWENQFSGGNQNPNKIYMYNARIGFMSNSSGSPNIYKTMNSGESWSVIVSSQYFRDMHFVDSLTGWYAYGNNMYKTTDGGINWITQILPYGGNIVDVGVYEFSILSVDTIWAVGGNVTYGFNGFRGILYRTIDGGSNWLFQLPDTSIHIVRYNYLQFVNKRNGWAYHVTQGGIHTTTGGDTTFYTGIQKISNEIPKEFKSYQNYPNPFNPRTVIGYQLSVISYVRLAVYDITGRQIIDLVNQKQNPGTYEVDFTGVGYSSGVYFYSLFIDNELIDTKKMILVK